ncbi:hypothetical protein N7466_002129 [Penicillium verhagenii]|uniref:uncharacterized protein n=1 Tax=Penicillium verhagenii TaxID=1562060 RepID=UPI002545B51A|nr:uncharacterized protein N7466_002129 [Penicillium verhagenii]KAJ5938995.1 hypothetical protein N7466_002129 [Penicillium verhagenii]
MNFWSFFCGRSSGTSSNNAAVSGAPQKSFQASKGWQPHAQEDSPEELSLHIPGAFPSSPSLSPKLAPAPTERVVDDVPTQEFDRMEIDIPSIPELHTDLGSHFRPIRPPRVFRPTPTHTPHSPSDLAQGQHGAHQEQMEIDDPWAKRSMAYEKLPFGLPVSAVQLVSPQKKPVPTNRLESIYASEWKKLELKRLEQEGEDGRPARIRPQGECVRQLSWDWLERVSKAMSSSGAVAQSLSGDALYPKDIATCIKPLAWLNDEIINSYLAVIMQYLQQSTGNKAPNERPKYHAFNSFFYSSLRDKGYDGVRRWAKRAKISGEGLLEVDTIFVPVHESSHWTLLVVRPADRTIEYFDSLGARSARQVKIIKTWLLGELGSKFVDSEWTLLPSVSSFQDNGSDCGVFLLTNAKAIALNIEPTAFGARDTALLRRKIVAEIMNGGLHGEFSPVDKTGTILL